MKRLLSLFRHPEPAEIEAQQLAEARRDLVLHRSAAEYHYAMIGMFQLRIARLEAAQKGAV